MFSDCSSLIGGQGTRVGSPNVADDYTYAHIDGGVTNPGYFTEKGASIPYAVLSTDYTVLTFYYDTNIENRGGIGPVSFRNGDERGWNDVLLIKIKLFQLFSILRLLIVRTGQQLHFGLMVALL